MERIVFMGTPAFAETVLSALIGRYEIAAVITQPDAEAGRGRIPCPPPVKMRALENRLTVLQPARVRHPEVVEQIRSLNPSAIVVTAFGQILPPSILSLPPHGCVNVHGSLLPRHRGAAPIAAAILAGDRETGITIMLMDAGMDTGPILSQASLEIAPDDTTATLSERMASLGSRLLLDTLPAWLSGQITPRKQDDSLATCTKMLKRENGLIDWALPAEMIERQVRAFHPWPGAFSHWGERQLRILRAHPASAEPSDLPPGTVVSAATKLAVVTGQGLLVLDMVQLAGRRPLPIEEFARGQRGLVGAVLH
jgi:methionyl-tRNA formyltransferase